MKEEIWVRLIRFLWVNVLNKETERLRLHEELQSSSNLALRVYLVLFCFSRRGLLLLGGLFFFGFSLIFCLLRLRNKVIALNVELLLVNFLNCLWKALHLKLVWYEVWRQCAIHKLLLMLCSKTLHILERLLTCHRLSTLELRNSVRSSRLLLWMILLPEVVLGAHWLIRPWLLLGGESGMSL